MAEYIDREAAKREFSLNFGGVSHAVIANSLLDGIPAADVAPVVRGRWKRYGRNLGECSNCSEIVATRHNYCPNCGARMDGES